MEVVCHICVVEDQRLGLCVPRIRRPHGSPAAFQVTLGCLARDEVLGLGMLALEAEHQG